ncbi:hypothetical protein AcV7_007746 [Taiwanofungus camphoratus]|nr:hypothetical protein AcV7_007746 [Antrodia cinnamomea]
MAPPMHARRVARSVSYVVLSSTPAGQMTLPLVDPATGKLERYALVKVADSPPKPESNACLKPARGRGSRRTLSEGGLSLDDIHAARAAKGKGPACPYEDYLLDVSLDALRIVDDSGWASPRRYSPPPSPKLKTTASFTRFHTRPASRNETPSLLEESQPSILSSPSVTIAQTPFRRLRPAARLDSASTGGSDASGSAPVGLGIMGMFKEDGSSFDGLGALPRGRHVTSTADPFEDGQWDWARHDRAREGGARTLQDDITEEGLLALEREWWSRVAAADLPSLLDEDSDVSLSSLCERMVRYNFQLASPMDQSGPGYSLSGSPGPSRLAQRRAQRHSMPCAPRQDDVFLSRPAARSSPMSGGRARQGRHKRDFSRPTATSLLRYSIQNFEREGERKPAWKP